MLNYMGYDITTSFIILGCFMVFHKIWYGHSWKRNMIGFLFMITSVSVALISVWGSGFFIAYIIVFNLVKSRGIKQRNRKAVIGSLLYGLVTVGYMLTYKLLNIIPIIIFISFIGLFIYWKYKDKKQNEQKRIFTGKLREDILKRDKYRCVNPKCRSKENLEIDHIKPFSKGGKTTYENGQTLCQKCNRSKGAKSQLAWKLQR